MKSSVDQIRARFDQDVERFSNLETGQSATIDAPLMLDLVSRAAAAVTPAARDLLDIGCGAGNYSLKLLQRLPGLNVTLVDLSRPMLDRAVARVGAATTGTVRAVQGDVREIAVEEGSTDIITAAAVFHHLRTDAEWAHVFAGCHRALRPGGALWIVDFVSHDDRAVQALMWAQYGEYLESFRDAAYRDHVFAYVEQEDSPRSVSFQTGALHAAGFARVELLHKHGCFAAFGAIKD
jgi:tRNA (cmo5U34)-methyltransferase